MLIIPPVTSTPLLKITHPNGGEVFSGTENIFFTLSDSSNPQSLIGNIHYSADANQFIADQNIISDVNLLNICDFSKGITTNTTNFNPPTLIATAGSETHLSIGSLDSNLTIIAFDEQAGNLFEGFNYDGTNFLINDSLVLNLNVELPPNSLDFDFFKIGSTDYMIVAIISSGNDTNRFMGFDFNGTQWNRNHAIVQGIQKEHGFGNIKYKAEHIAVVDFEGSTYLVMGSSVETLFPNTVFAWKWDGSSWQIDSLLFSDIANAIVPNMLGVSDSDHLGMDFFVDNDGILRGQFASFNTGGNNKRIGGGHFSQSTGQWVFDETYSADINALSGSSASGANALTASITQDYLNKTIAVTYLNGDVERVYELFANGFQTDTQATCTFPFDTTTAPNGFFFIDVNATNNTGASSFMSSTKKFQILNWTNSDISCLGITNVSSCILDINTFLITPINQTNDIEIKIINGGGLKNVGYKIINSRNDGKQYRAFTATQTDKTAGIWNFSDTITFGSTNYDSIQKLWQSASETYHYFFSDPIASNDTKYFQFEYYAPVFHFFSTTDPLWDNQLNPSINDNNSLQTDVFSVSTFSNMDSMLKIGRASCRERV